MKDGKNIFIENDQEHISSLESKILDIADTLFKDHGVISLSSLIQICNQKLKMPNKELISIILQLIHSNKIKKVSTILSKNIKNIIENNKSDNKTEQLTSLIIRNNKRKEIYLLLKSNQALTFSELKKITKLGNNQLNLYINQLVNFQIISFFNFGHSKVFYLSSEDKNSVIINYLLKKKYYREILVDLKKQKKRLAELVDILSVHHSTAQYYLKQLISLEIINIDRERNISYYSLKPNFRDLI